MPVTVNTVNRMFQRRSFADFVVKLFKRSEKKFNSTTAVFIKTDVVRVIATSFCATVNRILIRMSCTVLCVTFGFSHFDFISIIKLIWLGLERLLEQSSKPFLFYHETHKNNRFIGLPDELDIVGSRDNRTNRLKSLGNAIVPAIAYEIFKAIEQVNSEISLA
jgi:hypothetical protein